MAIQSKGNTAKRAIKQSGKKARKAPRKNQQRASKQKKVTGTVLRIVNGRPTNERLSAEEAFGDPQQAAEQVLYFAGVKVRNENSASLWNLDSILLQGKLGTADQDSVRLVQARILPGGDGLSVH